jgi:hypothetical protein
MIGLLKTLALRDILNTNTINMVTRASKTKPEIQSILDGNAW